MISKVEYKVPYAISSDLSFKWFSDILAKHSNVTVDMEKLTVLIKSGKTNSIS